MNTAAEDSIPPPGGGVLPYVGYRGMCGPNGYHGFSVVLVMAMNRVWFLYSSLDMGMLLRDAMFSSVAI